MMKKLLFAVVALSIVLGSIASALIVPMQASYRVEADNPMPTPTLLSPYANAVFVPTQPRLVCSEVLDPEGQAVTYLFSLDDNFDFSSPLINNVSCSTNVLKIGTDWQGNLASGVTYYWRACARDALGAQSAWSSVSSFTVDDSTFYFDDVNVGVKDMGVAGTVFADATDCRNAVYWAFGDVNRVFGTTNNLKCWFEVSGIYSYSGGFQDQIQANTHDLTVLYSDEQIGSGTYGWCRTIGYTYCTGPGTVGTPVASIRYTDPLVHELGHYRAVPDLYLLNVPSDQNGVMPGVGHVASFKVNGQQEIMDFPYGVHVFGDYSRAIISQSGTNTNVDTKDAMKYVPNFNYIEVRDNSGNPIPGAQVSVYANTPYSNLDGSMNFSSCIKNSANRQGQTDASGRFLFAQKARACDWPDLNISLLFVTVTYNGVTEYGWIEDIDAGGLYFGFKTSPILLKDGATFDIFYTDRATNLASNMFYRQQFTVNGSPDGNLSNYQIKLTVHKGSGSSTGSDVYLNGHCNDNFSDIRFTNSSGTTTLGYWIENVSSGNSATVWVKLDSVPASPSSASFFIYYGNTTALSLSNGNNTFPFFDDFTGNTLNTTNWNADWTWGSGGTVSVSNSILSINSNDSDSGKAIKSKTNFSVPYALRMKALIPAVNYNYIGLYVNTNTNPTLSQGQYAIFSYEAGNYTHESDGTGITNNVHTWSNAVFNTFDVCRTSTGASSFYVSNSLLESGAHRPSTASTMIRVVSYKSTTAIQVDWILMRNYTTNEPTWSAWGSETAK